MAETGERLILENKHWRLEILPDCGGKIVSMRDRCSGKEWLWQNSQLEQKQPAYGESFVEKLDTGGWDEILPSVDPCEVDGVAIPDHGDVAALRWEVEGSSETECQLAVTCRYAPLRFTRHLSLREELLHFEYSLKNNSEEPVPWNWFAHPLLALEPGCSLDIPEGTPFELLGGSVEKRRGEWPDAGDLNLETILKEGREVFAAKIMFDDFSSGEVAFSDGTGRSLKMNWNAKDLPVLALWINQGWWSGVGGQPYHNIGIEPGVSPFDSLAEAVESGTCAKLRPGEQVSWNLTVQVFS